MKNIAINFLALLMVTSCHFFGPIDSNIQTKNVDFEESDIIGTWKLDKFSYKYLSNKENLDSIIIQFKIDSTFQINNSKDLFEEKTNINEIVNGKLDNLITEGRWEKEGKSDIVLSNLDSKLNIKLKIFKKDTVYQLWYFFGDPDSGERLRFLKE